MDKRVYGVVGIASRMANWNADFSGFPKSFGDGQIFASDKSLKFSMKEYWQNQGLSVLGLRSQDIDSKGHFYVRNQEQRYDFLFPNNTKDMKSVLTNLFLLTDMKQFGGTFAIKNCSAAIRGAVQIGHGLNVDPDTEILEHEILSPYGNSNSDKTVNGEGGASMTTIGRQIMVDEAHYVFPFAVNPKAYQEYVQLGVTDGYTEDDYQTLKQAMLHSVTAYNSCSRAGCTNEFALFVETDEDVYLPMLNAFVSFEKDTKNKYHVDVVGLLNAYGNHIQKIDIYHDAKLVDLDGCVNTQIVEIHDMHL